MSVSVLLLLQFSNWTPMPNLSSIRFCSALISLEIWIRSEPVKLEADVVARFEKFEQQKQQQQLVEQLGKSWHGREASTFQIFYLHIYLPTDGMSACYLQIYLPRYGHDTSFTHDSPFSPKTIYYLNVSVLQSTSGQSYKQFTLVIYDSRVVNYDCRDFIRLDTGCEWGFKS